MSKIFAYRYHLVNVITLGMAQSDHVNQRPLLYYKVYLRLFVKSFQENCLPI
jgi:hypothetical protein